MRVKEQSSENLTPFDCPARPSVVVTRGGIVESEHFVRYAVAEPNGRIVESAGDVDAPTFLRSSAKPLICAVIVASGAADHFGLSDAELAMAAGSHSGEPYHVEAARAMLDKIGLPSEALACGAHAPLHEPSANVLLDEGRRPERIHNNCSGKHAAILALAVHLGASPGGYLDPEHPAQIAILDGCADMLGVTRGSMIIGVDGCGIPVVAVPLRVSAAFFARFADVPKLKPRWRDALERVRRAMVNYPEYVAGTGRFDSDLMRAAYPNVACKGGAEGFHASAAINRGIGLCVKVADGNHRAVPPFVTERLITLGVIGAEEARLLEHHRRPEVKNHAGVVVGRIRAI